MQTNKTISEKDKIIKLIEKRMEAVLIDIEETSSFSVGEKVELYEELKNIVTAIKNENYS